MDGVSLAEGPVLFDIGNDGQGIRRLPMTSWLLVMDLNGNGLIDSAPEVISEHYHVAGVKAPIHKDGFERSVDLMSWLNEDGSELFIIRLVWNSRSVMYQPPPAPEPSKKWTRHSAELFHGTRSAYEAQIYNLS